MNKTLITAALLLTAGCAAAQAQPDDLTPLPAPSTTSTTSTTTSTTTTTISPYAQVDWEALNSLIEAEEAADRERYGKCAEWRDLALSVGWTPEEWTTLNRVLWVESRCLPHAYNGNTATGDASYGLTQVNMIGELGPSRVERCGLTSYDDLFDPATNLACARVLYLARGWKPWAYID